MAVLHAGGLDYGVPVNLGGDGPVDDQVPQHRLKLLRGDATRPQKPGRVLRQIHDGGFHANGAGAAVHDGVDFAVVVMENMLGRGGGGLAGEIGRGGRDGNPCQANDFPGDLRFGAADGHGGKTTGGSLGDAVVGGQHHGQRPRPEPLRQTPGVFGNVMAKQGKLLRAGDVEDQGIVPGSALGDKDFRHRLRVQPVGPQAVDRLRGQGHQPAGFYEIRRHSRCLRRGSGKKQSFHVNLLPL